MTPYTVASSLDETMCSSVGAGLFHPNDPKYRCCFRCCHVRVGVHFIAVVECIGAVLALSLILITYFEKSISDGHPGGAVLENRAFRLVAATVSTVVALAVFVTTAAALYGISRQKHIFLLPHLVVQVMTAVMLAILIGLMAWATALTERSRGARESEKRNRDVGILVILLIVGTLGLILQLYFIHVTYRCYRYVKRRTMYGQVASFAIAYGGADPL